MENIIIVAALGFAGLLLFAYSRIETYKNIDDSYRDYGLEIVSGIVGFSIIVASIFLGFLFITGLLS